MAKKIIRPINGIDVDSAVNRRNDNSLYLAKNLRPNNLENTNLGEYTNIKGTNLVIEDTAAYTILKICKLKGKIILFVKTADVSDMDVICQVNESDIPSYGDSPITLDTYHTLGSSPIGNRIVAGEFGFSTTKEIEVKTYYESDTVQKIYWTIEGEPLRSLNIIFSDSNNPPGYLAKDLDMSPSVTLTEPVINKTISGNLTCGKIYYTYKLVNRNGSETGIAPLSKGYHLTKSSESDSNDYNYKGYGFDVNSTKGINLTISNIPTKFYKIKVYSIHYIDDVSLPKVSLIYDGASTSTFIINDTGIPLLDISPEEFLLTNGLLLNNGQLEIKNNRLFLANYEEQFFDIDDYADNGYWDARAYRFIASGGSARIYNESLSSYVDINGTIPNYAAISETHDCVNRSNDINFWNATTLTSNYAYKQNSASLGSSGLNISITQNILTDSVIPDNSNEDTKWFAKRDYWGHDSYADPHKDAYVRTFKLEEVYRLSIQFRNSKNQYSYPKWICDYKFVYDTTSYQPLGYTASPEKLTMYLFTLTVNVGNIPLDDDGNEFEYRIMYVPVEDRDQSVYWGLFNTLHKVTGTSTDYRAVGLKRTSDKSNTSIAQQTILPATVDYKYLEFISPDYCFGNKKQYLKFSIFKYASEASIRRNTLIYQANVYKPYSYTNAATTYMKLAIDSQFDVEYDIDIDNKVPLSGSDKLMRRSESVFQFKNNYYISKDGVGYGYAYGNSNKGRCQIIKATTEIASTYGYTPMWGCAYVDNFTSRYGGMSYGSRKLNGYIALTNFSSASSQTVYGDTKSGMFEYLRQISDNNTPYIKDNQSYGTADNGKAVATANGYLGGSTEIVIFPTYSTKNLKLRSDDYFTKIYSQNGSYMIHEYAGIYEDTLGNPNREDQYINRYSAILTQETDLYLYNNTYSREQDLFKFYEKEDSDSIIKVFKNRIIASDLKILGESSDSFLKINPASYIDVDGQYGEIKALKIFNDRLYFFQEHAIGIVAVNEQATTSSSNSSSLILGNVGLLSRYDYITINNGINDSNHVETSDNSMYIIDEIRQEFLRLGENGLEKISITKNINSLVKSHNLQAARIVYNRKYNEVQFHCRIFEDAITKYKAFVFNEMLNAFIGYFQYPFRVIDSESIELVGFVDRLILTSDYEVQTLNDGDYNKFNTSYSNSEITFLIPSNQEAVVLYNVVEMLLKQVDANGDDVSFIDTIRIYNSKYDTGALDFATNVKNKFGTYRTNKLRDYVNGNSRILTDHIYVTIATTSNQTGGIADNYRVFFRDLIMSFTEYNYFG